MNDKLDPMLKKADRWALICLILGIIAVVMLFAKVTVVGMAFIVCAAAALIVWAVYVRKALTIVW